MTTVSELGAMPNLPRNSPIRQSKLWNQDVTRVRPDQVITFVKRMELKGRGEEARSNIDLLLFTLNKYIARQDIGGSRIQNMKLYDSKPSVERLIELLEPINDMQRDAVLFSLTANMNFTDVIKLQWKDVLKMKLDTMSWRILKRNRKRDGRRRIFWNVGNRG